MQIDERYRPALARRTVMQRDRFGVLADADQGEPQLGLALQGQVALGLGAERIDGVAETGVQPALSARVDASYSPTRWLTIAASVDMGYWPRLQIVDFEGGVGSPDVQQTRIKNADTFFWIAPTLTATFRL